MSANFDLSSLWFYGIALTSSIVPSLAMWQRLSFKQHENSNKCTVKKTEVSGAGDSNWNNLRAGFRTDIWGMWFFFFGYKYCIWQHCQQTNDQTKHCTEGTNTIFYRSSEAKFNYFWHGRMLSARGHEEAPGPGGFEYNKCIVKSPYLILQNISWI